MLTLFQPPALFGLPNVSPFCLKLEAFLRWQRIEFSMKPAVPMQGPYKKVPFVEWNGQRIGDSSVIIDRLLVEHEITYVDNLELSVGHAFARMFEEHVYWSVVYFRWYEDLHWPKLKNEFFRKVPNLLRTFIANSVRKQTIRSLKGQGIGRLPREKILERVNKDLEALVAQLKTNRFICGDEMTHYDLSVWSILSQIVQCDLQTSLTDIAMNKPEIVAYLGRVNEQLDSEWINTCFTARKVG